MLIFRAAESLHLAARRRYNPASFLSARRRGALPSARQSLEGVVGLESRYRRGPPRAQRASRAATCPATSTAPLRRDLRAIFGEGAAASLMVGLGESYLSAFVLALGLGQVAAGLITTIPLMVGGCLQLVTPTAIRRLGSHRRWAIACAVLQALSLWPMAAGAAAGSMTVLAVFAAATLYWGSGLAVSSTWSRLGRNARAAADPDGILLGPHASGAVGDLGRIPRRWGEPAMGRRQPRLAHGLRGRVRGRVSVPIDVGRLHEPAKRGTVAGHALRAGFAG